MRNHRAAFILAVLLIAEPIGAQRQRSVERISPSAELTIWRDPIDDSEIVDLEIEGSTGYRKATLQLSCYGPTRVAYVSYGSESRIEYPELLVYRFDSRKPDTVRLDPQPPRRAYVGASYEIVFNDHPSLILLPDSVISRFPALVRSGQRLVVRVRAANGAHDAFFDLRGAAAGLDRLRCLGRSTPALLRGASVGGVSYLSEDELDRGPLPLDSAAVVTALDAARFSPEHLMVRFPEIESLVQAKVSESGMVDSVTVIGDENDEIAGLVRSMRFTPGEVGGRHVASEVQFVIRKRSERDVIRRR